MTFTNVLRLVSLLLVAISMSAGLAHVFELPHKIMLDRADYLTVQQIYRGWALLGIAVVGALVTTLSLAVLVKANRCAFYLTLAAAGCVAAGLTVFFLIVYPVNQQTLNWTVAPDNWQALRRQWEYGHVVGATLNVAAFITLAWSFLVK